jgi:hypothetical protein
MGFSVLVELLNIMARDTRQRKAAARRKELT